MASAKALAIWQTNAIQNVLISLEELCISQTFFAFAARPKVVTREKKETKKEHIWICNLVPIYSSFFPETLGDI